MLTHSLAAAALAVMLGHPISQATARPAVPAVDRPPMALADVGTAARALFDEAQANRWDGAAAQLVTLQKALQDLPGGVGPADIRGALQSRVRILSRNVRNRQRANTMDAANEVTRLVAALADSFVQPTPAQLSLLEYYGRQLEVGTAERRPAVVRRAVQDIRQAWDRIEPDLLRRNRADDVRRITDIVVSLEGKPEAPQVERLAKQELDAVQHLEATW